MPTRTASRSIRIVLVEPYALVRAALREILGRERDVEIVGEEATIADAAALLRSDPADVILVDTETMGEDLVPELQQLKRECPGAAIVLLGHQRGDRELFRAVQAGAAAHVQDAVRPAELARTIRAVAAGEYLIDADVAARPVVAHRVLDVFREATLTGEILVGDPPRRAFTRLTRRETQVLTAISEGMSNKEIASVLTISEHTVRNTVKAVLRKLAVNNRTRAVLVALRESWIPTPETPRPTPH